jgi:hypothetical protein
MRTIYLSVAPAAKLAMQAFPIAAIAACGAQGIPAGPGGPNTQVLGNGGPQCVIDGVSIAAPQAGGKSEQGSVDTSCVGSPTALDAPTTAPIEGCIDIFGLGGKAKPGLKLAVFKATQDPSTDAPAFGETDVAVPGDVGAQGLDCRNGDADAPACRALQCDKEGFYRLPSVATNEPLIFKLFETTSSAGRTAVDTYLFDVQFTNDEIGESGAINYTARLVYTTTYVSIPNLAGVVVEGGKDITDGIGRAVIAGEVRDCSGLLVENATLGTSEADTQTRASYFNGDLEDPSPDPSRRASNNDGKFTLLNVATDAEHRSHTIAAGFVDPSCAGADDCACISLGTRTVLAFPDSVSIVTLRGDLPIVR